MQMMYIWAPNWPISDLDCQILKHIWNPDILKNCRKPYVRANDFHNPYESHKKTSINPSQKLDVCLTTQYTQLFYKSYFCAFSRFLFVTLPKWISLGIINKYKYAKLRLKIVYKITPIKLPQAYSFVSLKHTLDYYRW